LVEYVMKADEEFHSYVWEQVCECVFFEIVMYVLFKL
jgi:hypothetical protein